ncbi:hypothetical protein BDV10DRAFT_185138 [Aspergillus recurvatus]
MKASTRAATPDPVDDPKRFHGTPHMTVSLEAPAEDRLSLEETLSVTVKLTHNGVVNDAGTQIQTQHAKSQSSFTTMSAILQILAPIAGITIMTRRKTAGNLNGARASTTVAHPD